MLTLEEARVYQAEAQRKSISCFLGTVFAVILFAIVVSFTDERAIYICIPISVFVLVFVGKRTRIIELLKKAGCSGEVTYFHVRTET